MKKVKDNMAEGSTENSLTTPNLKDFTEEDKETDIMMKLHLKPRLESYKRNKEDLNPV